MLYGMHMLLVTRSAAIHIYCSCVGAFTEDYLFVPSSTTTVVICVTCVRLDVRLHVQLAAIGIAGDSYRYESLVLRTH